jgi:hypothetical protein
VISPRVTTNINIDEIALDVKSFMKRRKENSIRENIE